MKKKQSDDPELLTPVMPDFILIKKNPEEQADSYDRGVPIGQLSVKQAEEVAGRLRKAFMDHWRKKNERYQHKNYAD